VSDKLNINYLKKINNHIKKLELNKLKLQEEQDKQQTLLEERLRSYEKIIKEKEELVTRYEEVLSFIINRGIFLNINTNSHFLKQWDSIKFINEKNKGILKDKNQQVVKVLEDAHLDMINDILKMGYDLSFLVIRVTNKNALIQGRFTKK
jgi:hypothetical protein